MEPSGRDGAKRFEARRHSRVSTETLQGSKHPETAGLEDCLSCDGGDGGDGSSTNLDKIKVIIIQSMQVEEIINS